jgi:hypothetical protein
LLADGRAEAAVHTSLRRCEGGDGDQGVTACLSLTAMVRLREIGKSPSDTLRFPSLARFGLLCGMVEVRETEVWVVVVGRCSRERRGRCWMLGARRSIMSAPPRLPCVVSDGKVGLGSQDCYSNGD